MGNEDTLLTAKRNVVAMWFWQRYFVRLVQRWFCEVRFYGIQEIRTSYAQGAPTVPWIFYCTHTSWWDAALVIVISLSVLRVPSYGMMDDKQLKKYRFFRWIGMFGVKPDNPRYVLQSFRYITSRIRGTKQALWMFPQGALVHQNMPIVCKDGLTVLTGMLGSVMAVPVALRYDIVHSQGIVGTVVFGAPELLDASARSHTFQDRLTSVARIAEQVAVENNQHAVDERLYGRRSLDVLYDLVTFRKNNREPTTSEKVNR
jgi:1-acyl-sn-glycerol-3-phosphate acyltransferase